MSPEIPISRLDPSFAPYDLDRSGGLSASELDRVVDSEVYQAFASALPPAETVAWLGRISPDKAFRVLAYFSPEAAASYLGQLSFDSWPAAIRILLHARENTAEPDSCRGQAAANLLRGLPDRQRANLLGWLGVFDAAHAASVSRQLVSGRAAVCEAAREARLEDTDVFSSYSGAVRPFGGTALNRLDPSRTAVIPMRAYVVSAASSRDFLMTPDVSTCSALSLYDPATRTGVLAHFDVGSDLHNSLDLILAELADRGIPASRLEARLVGGNALLGASRNFRADLRQRLRLEGVAVLEFEEGAEGMRARAFALDLRTGELHGYQGPRLPLGPAAPSPGHPGLLYRSLFSD